MRAARYRDSVVLLNPRAGTNSTPNSGVTEGRKPKVTRSLPGRCFKPDGCDSCPSKRRFGCKRVEPRFAKPPTGAPHHSLGSGDQAKRGRRSPRSTSAHPKPIRETTSMGVSRPHDAASLIKSTAAHASGFLGFSRHLAWLAGAKRDKQNIKTNAMGTGILERQVARFRTV